MNTQSWLQGVQKVDHAPQAIPCLMLHVAARCALHVARCTLRLRRPQPKPKHRKNVAAENKHNAWPAKKGGEGAGGTEEGVGGGEEEGAGGGGGNKPKAAKQTEKEHNNKNRRNTRRI